MARRQLGAAASTGVHLLTRDDADARYGISGSGMKNLLYNPDYRIAQRGSSVSGITSTDALTGLLTADRWAFRVNSCGTWTMSIEDDTTFPTAPSRKSLKFLCTTADASPAAADDVRLWQLIEGNDLQHVMKGKSGAQPLTLSFPVKSNISGTFIAVLYDNDNTRSVSKSFVLTANVVSQVTITFPADTTGQFDADTSTSLYLQIWLAAGSNFTSGTLQTTWGTVVNANVAVGQTNLAAAVNNYIQIGPMQLEVGSFATPWEHRPYSIEHEMCRRSYQRFLSGSSYSYLLHGYSWHSQNAHFFLPLSTPMRTNPTIAVSSISHWKITDGVNEFVVTSAITTDANANRKDAHSHVDGVYINAALTTTSLTQFRPYNLVGVTGNAGWLGLSADLS